VIFKQNYTRSMTVGHIIYDQAIFVVLHRLKELYSIRDQQEVHPSNNIARATRQAVERKPDAPTKPKHSNRSLSKRSCC